MSLPYFAMASAYVIRGSGKVTYVQQQQQCAGVGSYHTGLLIWQLMATRLRQIQIPLVHPASCTFAAVSLPPAHYINT